MFDPDLTDHLAHIPRPAVGPIGRFGPQRLDPFGAEGRQVAVSQHLLDPLDHRIGLTFSLAGGIAPHHRHGGEAAPAIGMGDRDLVEAARRAALGLADPHPLFPDLFQLQTSEITDHIGQHIGLGITDLIEDLFADRGAGDQTARALRLGDDEGAIGGAFDNRIANMGPVRHALPIGKEPARGLRPALDDVTGQRATGKLIIIAGLPAELEHQGREHEGGIDHPARDHHIGPGP